MGPRLRLCIACAVLLAGSVDAQGHVWTQSPVNGHWYAETLQPATWSTAETEAVLSGGHLATIHSQAENDWLLQTFVLPNPPELWIGFTDEAVEDTWVWTSGDPVVFTSWETGQPDAAPDEDYGYLFQSGNWHDSFGTHSVPGIIEVISDDCDSDGVPDRYQIATVAGSDCNGNGVLDACEPSSEVVRLGTPPNPNAFLPGQTIGPILGAHWDPVVDHTTFLPAAVVDVIAVTANPLNSPLPPLGTLLCDLGATIHVEPTPAGTPFDVLVPGDCVFVGTSVCTQAASIDAVGNVRLTNALDVTVGTF